jgi:hypothetical protein
MFIRTTLAAVAFAALSIPAQAQSTGPAATPGVDQRQANQDKRIDQGVASGQLTRREARRLEREQHAIDRAEDRAKADGVVTQQERARLHHRQDRASQHIRHQKHDRQARPPAAKASS